MKLSITNDALKQARNEPQTSIALALNTTGLSYREQADMLLALAQSVEALANRQDEADALRATVAASGPDMTTTTRLALPAPELILLHGPNGQERGAAKFILIEPPAPKRKRQAPKRKRNLSNRDLFFQGFDDEPEPGPEREREREDGEYQEDDEVEFHLRGAWRRAVVVDGGMGVYIIRDDYGRKVRVTSDNIRTPLEW